MCGDNKVLECDVDLLNARELEGCASPKPICDGGKCICPECAGVCRDTTKDPKHCGTCDHSCLAGTCRQSLCDITQLGSFQSESRDGGRLNLAVDASGVYWITTKNIVKIPLAGGTATTLATLKTTPATGVVLDSGSVYWAEAATSDTPTTLYRIPVDGGDPFALLTDSTGTFLELAVYDGYVYAVKGTAGAQQSIVRVATSGGSARTVASSQSNIRRLSVEASGIYWIDSSAMFGTGGAIVKTQLTGGAATQLVPGVHPTGLAVASGDVIWTEQTHVGILASSGGTPSLLEARLPLGSDIVLDRSFIYVSGGAVVRLGRDGSAPLLLASSSNRRTGLAIDEAYVYWSSQGALERLPK